MGVIWRGSYDPKVDLTIRPDEVEWWSDCPSCGTDSIWRSARRYDRIDKMIDCNSCGPIEWTYKYLQSENDYNNA